MRIFFTFSWWLLVALLSGTSSKPRRHIQRNESNNSDLTPSAVFAEKHYSCKLSCTKPPGSLCIESSNRTCFCQCVNEALPCPPPSNATCPSGSPPTCYVEEKFCFCKCW
ncbi:uncharacterized protein [Dermacentor andersoni]|uniref:uncharacterized protein n=1 Tax=Dermacentor andersoni TaxID=34620 RepID=UPI002417DF26|nr:uncharacterized protein LOC129385365 [Dermacentor andersoni]